jgi:hypothetical protein
VVRAQARAAAAGYIGLQNHDPGDVVYIKELGVRLLDKRK